MKIRMAQLIVGKNIQENLEKVVRVLADAQIFGEDIWVNSSLPAILAYE